MTVYAFDEFEVDEAKFELRQAGRVVPMEPQVLRILLMLIECRERLVTKDDLFGRIWNGRFVSDAALSSRIKSLRQALGDDGANQRYIRTLRGEGFRFVGSIAERTESSEPIFPSIANVMARPLIGVFPFAFDRDDAEYLVDGLAETLISELATWRWFPVLSRNATFAGERHGGDLIARARALHVRYAVTGKVASHGDRARLTIELVDVASAETLLTEIFEDGLDELTTLQGQIASTILRQIAPELEGAERRRIVRVPRANLSAWDLTLKALWALNLPSPASLTTALKELESSIALDPGVALPWSLKAQAHFEIGLNGWLDGNVSKAHSCFVDMLSAARQSISLDPRGWMGHSLASAGELWAQGAYGPARFHAEEALRLNPSAGMAHHFSGCIIGFGGDPAQAVAIQQCVYAVDPDYRHATVIEADLGLWQFLLNDMECALHHLDRSLSLNARNQRALQRRIAVRSRLGDYDGARQDVEALAAQGITLTKDYVRGSYPFQTGDHGDRLIDAMFCEQVFS